MFFSYEFWTPATHDSVDLTGDLAASLRRNSGDPVASLRDDSYVKAASSAVSNVSNQTLAPFLVSNVPNQYSLRPATRNSDNLMGCHQEEEEESSNRWKDFLERQLESAQLPVNGFSAEEEDKASSEEAEGGSESNKTPKGNNLNGEPEAQEGKRTESYT